MTPLSRRVALRAIAAMVPSAMFMAEKSRRDMVLDAGIADNPSELPGNSQGDKFTDFAMWFSRFGHASMKLEARNIRGFDGDIIDMRLPMATKVRIQRNRNYARILIERKRWFADRLGVHGFVEWWP